MERCEASFLNDYVKVKERARGLRGVIRHVRGKADGADFCAKTIRKVQKGRSVEHEIDAEIEALVRMAGNTGVVTLNAVYQTPREVTLILDLHKGDLHQLIEQEEEKYDAKQIMHDLVRIVKDCHAKGILHLDLKPQNVLLAADSGDDDQGNASTIKLKLCDFGLAQFESDENKENLLLGGTLEYSAPEQIQFEPVTDKTDVWSLGVIAYVLATSSSPFKQDQEFATQNAILEGDYDLDLVPCPEGSVIDCYVSPATAIKSSSQSSPIKSEKLHCPVLTEIAQRPADLCRAAG